MEQRDADLSGADLDAGYPADGEAGTGLDAVSETTAEGGSDSGAYGSSCTPGAASSCAFSMTCLGITGGTSSKGYCTKSCTGVTDTSCTTSSPSGTVAGCIIKGVSDAGSSVFFCGFICEYSGTIYSCPSSLSCQSSGTTGLKVCYP